VGQTLSSVNPAHFDETGLINLTLAVIAINSWNRLAISMRAVPGIYQRQPSMAAH
jgi:alkylhydroperoxidase family enzyme